LVSGRIVSCDPKKTFGGGTVTVIDTINNKVVFTKEVGTDGMYSLMLEDYQPLKVEAKANEFISGSLNFNAPPDPEQESLKNPDLCLIPVPPKVDEVFVVNNLYYEFDKAIIKPESYPAMDDLVTMLNTYPTLTIEISAHTDAIGSDDYNMKLSEARAKNVVAYLIEKGIDPARLTAKGYGETMPVAPNKKPNGKDDPEGREKNRRTEFKVLKN
jgi:outer membrane protein OmpA-like peptidoglycan-associated protein